MRRFCSTSRITSRSRSWIRFRKRSIGSRKKGVDETELERVKAVLRFQKVTGLQSSLARAKLLGQYELLDGKPEMVDQDFTNLFAVTSAQIQAVAKKYLTAARHDVLDDSARAAAAKGGSEMRKPNVAHALWCRVDSHVVVRSTSLMAALPLAAQTVDLSKPPVSRDPRPYKLPPVFETKLPNGLTVMLAEDARFPLVTARLVFLAGNKRDPKDIPGLAASVAAMLMQGTSKRTYQQIAEELDSLGGTLTAATGADALTVEASVLAENTGRMLALISDVSRNAVFPTNELNLHKQNRKQTLMVQHSQPAYLANEEYRKVLFGDTPYAHIGPTAESIDKIDQKALEDFRDTYLVPNNAYLILVGKLPARAEMLKTISRPVRILGAETGARLCLAEASRTETGTGADRPARIGAGGHAHGQDRGHLQRSRLFPRNCGLHHRRRRRRTRGSSSISGRSADLRMTCIRKSARLPMRPLSPRSRR